MTNAERIRATNDEELADQLHYAQAERDVVTKRMIALETQNAQ